MSLAQRIEEVLKLIDEVLAMPARANRQARERPADAPDVAAPAAGAP